MSRLDEFIGKGSDDPDKSLMRKVGVKYQCQTCDLYTEDSYFNDQDMTMYWYCSNNHSSKVAIGVRGI